MIFSVEEVLRATGGRLLQGERNVFFEGVSTDSRTIGEGELYFALKGPHFDGHHYALEALEKKAAGVVVEEEKARDIHWNGHSIEDHHPGQGYASGPGRSCPGEKAADIRPLSWP